MPGAGWTGVLLPRGEQLLDFEDGKGKLPDYAPNLAWGPSGAKESSPNHEAEAWSIELLRAVLSENMAQAVEAYGVIMKAYFPREMPSAYPGSNLGVGLWTSEQGCPDPHGGQHLAGVSLTMYAALKWGKDCPLDLLAGARRLLAANAAFLLSMSTDGRTVWMPGFRAPGLNPTSYVASAWLRELKGEKHQGSLRKPDAGDWTFPNYLAIRAMRMIRRNWPDEADSWKVLAAGPVQLKFPVDVQRWQGGFSASMGVAPPGLETVLWTRVDGKKGFNKGGDLKTFPAVDKSKAVTSIHHTSFKA